jgi:RHS repeat-associated protein
VVQFAYGPDRQRWQQNYNSGTEVTNYIGGLLEQVGAGGITTWRHYIYAGREPVAVYSRTSTLVNTWSYFLSNNQGSIAAITNSSGAIDVNEDFAAFGARRNPTTWSGAPTSGDLTTIAGLSRQGYTFQTALGQSMGLNHMNGRVQDAITGRFLSADPYIPDPSNTQDYNRYSYVDNNPLSFTDPTGFDPYCNPTTEPGASCPDISSDIQTDTAYDVGPDCDSPEATDCDIPGVGNGSGPSAPPTLNAGGTPYSDLGTGGSPFNILTNYQGAQSTTAPAQSPKPQTTLQEVTVNARRMTPCDQLNGANDTIVPLLDAATNAFNEYPMRPIDQVWPLSALRGTFIHSYFAREVTALGAPYSAEVSYLGGLPVPYGTPGSIRADAVVGPMNAPLYAVELKSGYAVPSAAETAAYYANLPAGTGVCSIVEAPGPP